MALSNTGAIALMDSPEKWREWQQNNPNDKKIIGINLGALGREGLEFNGYQFEFCDFESTKLESTKFIACTLTNCNFINADLSEANFNRSRLTNVSFKDSVMVRSDLSGTRVSNVDFTNTTLSDANLKGMRGKQVRINDANMSSVNLQNSNIVDLIGNNVDMQSSRFDGSTLLDSVLTSSRFNGANFNNANLSGADLTKAVLSPSDPLNPGGTRCDFRHAKLVGAVLKSADLRSVDFSHAVLSKSNLRSAKVDAWTRFEECPPPTDMQIDRYALETLGDDYGGFTQGHRMVMKVFDDASVIRRQFSGIYRLTHTLALIVFVTPYLWFLAMRWAEASFQAPTGRSMSIIEAFARFLLVGNETWRDGWGITWSFGLLLIAIIYNLVRLYFLKTTLDLEMHERVYSLPAKYSLTGFRAFLYSILRWGLIVYLAVITCNTILFLLREFPLPVG